MRAYLELDDVGVAKRFEHCHLTPEDLPAGKTLVLQHLDGHGTHAVQCSFQHLHQAISTLVKCQQKSMPMQQFSHLDTQE